MSLFFLDTCTHAYAWYAMSHRLFSGLDSHSNRIFLGGQRREAHRLSLGLHRTGQPQSQGVAQKAYVHRRPLTDPSIVSRNAPVSVNECARETGRQSCSPVSLSKIFSVMSVLQCVSFQ